MRSDCRSQWPRGLRLRSTAARLLRSWVQIQAGIWMFVCCVCCVFLGRGLCDELITRRGEPYRIGATLCVITEPREWGGHSPRWAAGPEKIINNRCVQIIAWCGISLSGTNILPRKVFNHRLKHTVSKPRRRHSAKKKVLFRWGYLKNYINLNWNLIWWHVWNIHGSSWVI
jgi:hypothetical protein